MTIALQIAALGMLAQQTQVNVISNNLANLSTSGYKRERPEFATLLYQDQRRVGSNSSDSGTIVPTGIQLGLGARTVAIYRNNIQGTMQQTENPMDLAIQGKGYLQIQLPDGTTAYTRAGALQASETGQIVTSDGYPVLPAITIPQGAQSVTINSSGEVFAKLQGQVNPQNLGQLQLATFINENGLDPVGNNLLLESTASGPAITGTPAQDGVGTILQGFLEASNVNSISEITNLIVAQRAYEQNSRIVSKQDEMMQEIARMVA